MAHLRNITLGRHPIFLISLFILLFLIDQITKNFVYKNLNNVVTILPFFHLRLTTNTGAAFGLFPQGHLVFLIIGICVFLSIALFLGIKRDSLSTHELILLSIIEAGILGNIIDRIFRGHVVDFLQLPYWPIFNFADMYISISVCVFICYEIYGICVHKKKKIT